MDELLEKLQELLIQFRTKTQGEDPQAEWFNVFVMREEEQVRGLRDQDVPCAVLMPAGENTIQGPAAGVSTRTLTIIVRLIEQSVDKTKYDTKYNYFNLFRKTDAIRAEIHANKDLGTVGNADLFIYGKSVPETVIERSNGYWTARDLTFAWKRWEDESGERNNDKGLNTPNTEPYQYVRNT